MRTRLRVQSGFTLTELVIIIVVLGVLATFAAAKYSDFLDQSKIVSTKTELGILKRAIAGNPNVAAGGRYTDVGFLGDVGFAPGSLQDLVRKPDSVAIYNKISRFGWHGPYIDSTNSDYLKDAWGVTYVYNPAARSITSTGSGTNITVTF